MRKPIQQILPPPAPHMVGDGFRVHNFFPSGYDMPQDRMSPFFLMDYNSKVEFSPTDKPRGVGVHPHRGFETVTIAFHGRVAHHDSAGNSGVITEGGVQWMTAGSGVLHKEYHDETFSKTGGLFQMVQLWVNLPAKDKMTAPKYQGISKEQMTTIKHYGVEVRLIAGEIEGKTGPASTFSPIVMAVIELQAGAEYSFGLEETFNTGILVVDGNVNLQEDYFAEENQFVLFQNSGTDIHLKSQSGAQLLLLSGQGLNEPIAAHGPFLMNTYEEIHQAIKDYNQGKFGFLEE